MSTETLTGEAAAVTPAVVTTCKHCGSDKGFREYGTVTTHTYRDTRRIESVDGKAKARWESVDEPFVHDEDFEPDYAMCRNCDAQDGSVNDLLGTPVSYAPGDRVQCPDGLEGVVATVDEDARTLTIVDWHETFAYGEVWT